jgi:hypothetical protein
MPLFGGSGLSITMKGANTNLVTLQAGECYYPNSNQNPTQPGQGTGNAGWFYAQLGRYSKWQFLDPITGIWRGIGDDSNAERYFYSDGFNTRIANQSGCAVGAVVTTAGSGYTSAPTVVASAGSSKWVAVLGPLVSTAVTVGFGGSNYTYPPAVVIDAPPGVANNANGVQATGYATISGGVVTTITITNQGAGYTAGVPNIRLVNDIRDQTGSGAVATAALTGAGTVAAVLCLDHGNPITSGTVPTLSFGSGSAAATALMDWGVTTYSVSTAGQGYAGSAVGYVGGTSYGPAPISGAAYTNPAIQEDLVIKRNANIWVLTSTIGALLIGGVIRDGGVYTGVPTNSEILGQGVSVGVLGVSMGGFTDTCLIQPW